MGKVSASQSGSIHAPTQEIAPGVHWLGPLGRTQTNVYLVGAGESWVLVDTAWAKDGSLIQMAAGQLFGTDVPPTAIVLTHAHPDHAGSARELALAWDCPVYVHPLELPLATGDFSAMIACAGPLDSWVILPILRLIGQQRRHAILSRSSLKPVVQALDPDSEAPGLPGWQCIPTPGHTPGHLSFFRASDRVLITGDAVVTLELNSLWGLLRQREALSGPPWYTTWDRSAARESIAMLARLEPIVLASGHGRPQIGERTGRVLREFAELLADSNGI